MVGHRTHYSANPAKHRLIFTCVSLCRKTYIALSLLIKFYGAACQIRTDEWLLTKQLL